MPDRRLTITILTDETSWMNSFDRLLEERLTEAGHDVAHVAHKNDLRKGDVAFLLSCFEIVNDEFLSRNRHNIVVHASRLPLGKGWSPATWQIIEGKNEIPLSLFEATDKVDAGPIYLRDVLRLDGSELVDKWQKALGMKIVDLCVAFAKRLSVGEVVGNAQTGEETFYPRRRPSDSQIDPDKTIGEQFNLLRVVDNEKYPAFFIRNGKRYVLKIYED